MSAHSRPSKDYVPSAVDHLQQFVQNIAAGLSPLTDSPADVAGLQATEYVTAASHSRLVLGVVRYAMPHINCYSVALDSGGVVEATTLLQGTLQTGARQHCVYQPGQVVLLAIRDESESALILGATPGVRTGDSHSFSDFLSPGAPVGLHASPQHTDYMQVLGDLGGAIPFDADSPVDALPGDYTITTLTGGTLHLDDEMLLLRSSELCGLSLFAEDGHARLSGETLRLESPAFQQEHGVVGHESVVSAGHCLYPWEAAGAATPQDLQPPDRLDEDELGVADRHAAEPQQLDQQPIHRIETFGGYLGQGELQLVSAPQGNGVNTLRQGVPRHGLSRKQDLLDGSLLTETVRQVFIAKVTDIPQLRRTAEPDAFDLEQLDYRFSGLGEAGPEHKIASLSSEIPVMAGLGVEEMYAYASGWQGLHAAAYHPQVEGKYSGFDWQSPAQQADLRQQDWLYPENLQTATTQIDHRYGEATLYRANSMIGITETGDIVLRHGSGAEVVVTAAGILFNGVSLHMNIAKTLSVASNLISLRANRHFEASCSTGRLLLKAQTDLNLLGGAGGSGGILIESRSNSLTSDWRETPDQSHGSGLVLKSATSHVSLLGGELLLKTGPGGEDTASGSIVIDCDGNEIITRCRTQLRYADQYYDYFGTAPSEEPLAANYYSASDLLLSGNLRARGQAIVGGAVQAGGGFATHRGRYRSGSGQTYIESGGSYVTGNVTQAEEARQTQTQYAFDRWQASQLRLAEENLPLHPTVIWRSRFGFLDSRSYGTESLKVAQPLWQREHTSLLQSWEEPVVRFDGSVPTRPWPGEQTWNRDNSFLMLDRSESLFDPHAQLPLSPFSQEGREAYEAGQLRGVREGRIGTHTMTFRSDDP